MEALDRGLDIQRLPIRIYYVTDDCEKERQDFPSVSSDRCPANARAPRESAEAVEQGIPIIRMSWLTTGPEYKYEIGGDIFNTPEDCEKIGYSFLQSC